LQTAVSEHPARDLEPALLQDLHDLRAARALSKLSVDCGHQLTVLRRLGGHLNRIDFWLLGPVRR
jgi:hypothetical protein